MINDEKGLMTLVLFDELLITVLMYLKRWFYEGGG